MGWVRTRHLQNFVFVLSHVRFFKSSAYYMYLYSTGRYLLYCISTDHHPKILLPNQRRCNALCAPPRARHPASQQLVPPSSSDIPSSYPSLLPSFNHINQPSFLPSFPYNQTSSTNRRRLSGTSTEPFVHTIPPPDSRNLSLRYRARLAAGHISVSTHAAARPFATSHFRPSPTHHRRQPQTFFTRHNNNHNRNGLSPPHTVNNQSDECAHEPATVSCSEQPSLRPSFSPSTRYLTPPATYPARLVVCDLNMMLTYNRRWKKAKSRR